jgi:VCBS repeat-containing protein
LQPFDDVVFTDNTIVAQRPVSLTTPKDRVISDYDWDHNRYLSAQSPSFSLDNAGRSFDAWRNSTGFDAGSSVQQILPDPDVFVRPNQYESGRANVVVYNWGEWSAVDVDLSSVLRVGDRYELLNAMDFYGEPVLSGVFDGRSIRLPMTNRSAVSPLGYSDRAPVGTDARFGVFVVRTTHADAELQVIPGNTTSQLGATVTLAADGSFTYDPATSAQAAQLAAGQSIQDSFSYTVTDGTQTDSARVTISVTGSGGRRPSSDQASRAPDVNRDGAISAVDALMVINQLNQGTDSHSKIAEGEQVSVDVNADGLVSAADALIVINALDTEPARSEVGPVNGAPTADAAFSSWQKDNHQIESNRGHDGDSSADFGESAEAAPARIESGDPSDSSAEPATPAGAEDRPLNSDIDRRVQLIDGSDSR